MRRDQRKNYKVRISILMLVHSSDINSDFKEQFEIFYKELKEFFNAQSLDTLLISV
jgi:hypothetical protein